MKYAVIKLGGKQYKVSEGQEITADKIHGKKKDDIFEIEPLMVRDEKDVYLGKPNLDNYKVMLKILNEEKGEKIDVFRFKAKVRYRKKIGFRPLYFKIHVEKIEKKAVK